MCSAECSPTIPPTVTEIPGFQLGHEGERAPEGLSVGHSEITASSNVDDKFFGSLTLGVGSHPGEADEMELEEAYMQTLPGAGLPDGVRIKAGRALWTFGYLNELHAHGDDFADRPLPYRAFLDNAYNDDGVEVSVVLPTESYTEIGAGMFRGSDTPSAALKTVSTHGPASSGWATTLAAPAHGGSADTY